MPSKQSRLRAGRSPSLGVGRGIGEQILDQKPLAVIELSSGFRPGSRCGEPAWLCAGSIGHDVASFRRVPSLATRTPICSLRDTFRTGSRHSGRTGAFRKWLRTILVHRLQNFWRSQQRSPVRVGTSSVFEQLAELEDDTSSASRMWDADHDRHVLSSLLDDIRPRFEPATWDAFQRQMFLGEKGEAVAAELGMSLKAVQLAKSRVLQALRSQAVGLIDSA